MRHHAARLSRRYRDRRWVAIVAFVNGNVRCAGYRNGLVDNWRVLQMVRRRFQRIYARCKRWMNSVVQSQLVCNRKWTAQKSKMRQTKMGRFQNASEYSACNWKTILTLDDRLLWKLKFITEILSTRMSAVDIQFCPLPRTKWLCRACKMLTFRLRLIFFCNAAAITLDPFKISPSISVRGLVPKLRFGVVTPVFCPVAVPSFRGNCTFLVSRQGSVTQSSRRLLTGKEKSTKNYKSFDHWVSVGILRAPNIRPSMNEFARKTISTHSQHNEHKIKVHPVFHEYW